MKKFFFIILIFSFNSQAFSSNKENIIQNLKDIRNIKFDFEQNINGKTEQGMCVIEYPLKINCKYNNANKKILISNGKSLVIKNNAGSYYLYPIEKTVLNYILDKNFIISEIKKAEERVIDNKFINYTFFKDENEINIFFDNKNYNLIGWQTLDIYQNLNITYLSSVIKNQKLKKNLFKIPLQD